MVNVVNIGGNAFFIFVLRIGVTGAALSTLISRTCAAAVLLGMLIANPRSPVSLSGLWKIGLRRSMIRNILNVGIPSGVESSMFQIGRLATQRIFTLFGTAAIAANAVTGVINSISFMPGSAYGIALLTVVGQCVGAGDYGEAKKQAAKILKLSYLTLFIMSGLIFIFAGPLTGLFGLSPEARGMAKTFLQVHCFFMITFWTLSFALPNALRAAGDARFVMIAATVSMWTVRVCGAYLLVFPCKIGPLGVWLAMGGDFICRGACYLTRWLGGKWQGKRVIQE
jgi:Na+-driven multidrug efflux pump